MITAAYVLDYADALRGRVLDLTPDYLTRIAEAVAADPPADIHRAVCAMYAGQLAREHYHLTTGDLRGIKRRRTKE